MTQTLDDSSSSTEGAPSSLEQETSRGGIDGLFSRFFGSGKRKSSVDWLSDEPSQAEDEEAQPSAPTGSSAAPMGSSAAPSTPAEPAWAPPKSKEEFDRSVQAETDRRAEAQKRKAERELSESVKASRDAQLLQLEQQKDEAIADGDLARAQQISGQQRVLMAQRRQGEWVQNTLMQFDAATLLPMFEGLDQKDTEKIVADLQGMDPLPGRTYAVKEALKLHEKRIRADEARKTRQKLLKDEAFVFEARGRGRDDEWDQEVDHIEGRATQNGSRTSANDALQDLILSHRGS